MFLPLSDAPNPRGVPFVTWGLIALNVAVYVLITWPLSHEPVNPADPLLPEYLALIQNVVPQGIPVEAVLRHISVYDLFVFRHGYRPSAPQGWDLLTSIFLHGGLLHLLGNMLFLWIYGDNVEHRLGRWLYLLAYIACGIAATLFYSVFAGGSGFPLVGASGAISGVLGFYFLWFPKNVVRIFVFLFPFLMDVFVVSARLVLGFFLVLDNLLPFLLTPSRAGGGVAHGAHIGGFIAGLLLAGLLNRREDGKGVREFRRRPSPGVAAPVEAVHAAIARGDFDEAARTYFSLESSGTRRLLSPGESLALADWLARQGNNQAALNLHRRHIRDYPSGPGLAEAHLGAGRILLDGFGQATAAYQHFLEGLDARPSPEVEAEIRGELQEIASRQKYRFGRFSR